MPAAFRSTHRVPSAGVERTSSLSDWGFWAPLVAAILLLTSIPVILLSFQRQNERVRWIIANISVPVREALHHLEVALSQEAIAWRGYLLSGESESLELYFSSRERARQAFGRARPLAAQLDPKLAERIDETWTLTELQHADQLQSLLEISPVAFARAFEKQDSVLTAIRAAVDQLHHDLTRQDQQLRNGIEARERLGAAAIVWLAVLGLLLLLLTVRFSRRLRHRARDEAALNDATRALIAAEGVEDVLHELVRGAARADRGGSAWLLEGDANFTLFSVRAAAGSAAAASSDPGALSLESGAREAWRAGEPWFIADLQASALGLLLSNRAPLERFHGVCIPLLPETGVKVLLVARNAKRPVGFHDLAGLRILCTMASLAVRRAALLAESERKRHELRQVIDSRERLIRGFSHDIKNPLTAADIFLQLLENGVYGPLSDAQLQPILRVHTATGFSLRLIEDMLEIARAEAGRLQHLAADCELLPLIRDVLEEYGPQAEASQLTLLADLPPFLPTAACDPARVRQILSNLVQNAIRYTPAGGTVVVRSAPGDEPGARAPVHQRLGLEVSDTGPGIPALMQDDIFQEFVRLDNRGPGTGIGLAMSRSLARAMGGDITVMSQVGAGSTFTLWLPISEQVKSNDTTPGPGGAPDSPRRWSLRPPTGAWPHSELYSQAPAGNVLTVSMPAQPDPATDTPPSQF